MDFRVFSRNISENMHARCVREDTKQALKGNLQADGVQSRQTLFVRYCHRSFMDCGNLQTRKANGKKSAMRIYEVQERTTPLPESGW